MVDVRVEHNAAGWVAAEDGDDIGSSSVVVGMGKGVFGSSVRVVTVHSRLKCWRNLRFLARWTFEAISRIGGKPENRLWASTLGLCTARSVRCQAPFTIADTCTGRRGQCGIDIITNEAY